MSSQQKENLIDCLQDIAEHSGFESLESFRLYKESILGDNCISGYKSVYPEEPVISTAENKIYVDNLKVMLADNLYKGNSFITLKEKIQQPPIGWWASEKWDGIRALWDGEKIISRGSERGKPKVYSYVPEWFIKTLPPGIAIDGEIWIGRGLFQQTSKLSNVKIGGKYSKYELENIWTGTSKNLPVIFKAFDLPTKKLPFEQRMAMLKTIVDDRFKCWEQKITYTNKKYFPIHFTEQIKILSLEHLVGLYDTLTASGAEGIILRAPGSPYEPKRSKYMLKYKIKEDAECIVRGYNPGKERLVGSLGSLECEILHEGLPSGIFTHIGTGFNDLQRKEHNDPNSKEYIPIGSIVSFSYMEMTKDGIPRHPVYRGIRTDIKKVDRNITKEDIIKIFNKLISKVEAERAANWAFKRKSYNNIIDILTETSQQLNNLDDYISVLKIKDVEKSTNLQKIKEILNTGTLKDLKEDPKVLAVEELTTIPYIGPANAIKLYEKYGIKNIEELRIAYKSDKDILNDQQSISLRHYLDVRQRIPRSEMDLWKDILEDIFKQTLKNLSIKPLNAEIQLVGSYRRGAESSGDIDIIIISDDIKSPILKKFLILLIEAKIISLDDILSSGNNQIKSIGIIEDISRHIDISYFSKGEYPFALLHSTGSGSFNQKIRAEANQQGYSLSEKSIKKGDTTGLLVSEEEYIEKIGKPKPETEEDIFAFFHLEYVSPSDRETVHNLSRIHQ